MEEERELQLNIISATHLKKVKALGHQKSYVVVYIHSDEKYTSDVDNEGGLNPTWNFKVTLRCAEHLMQNHGNYLNLEIYSGHVSSHAPLIGAVAIPLRDIGKNVRCHVEPDLMSFQVRRPSGKAKGVLNLSVKLGALEKKKIETHHPRGDYPPFPGTRVDQAHKSSCDCDVCK